MNMRNEMLMGAECEKVFRRMGTVYNANTPENFPVVFRVAADFKVAISILGICTRMTPGIKIFAFQLMSNHIHLVIGGEREAILAFFKHYINALL